MDSRVIGRKVSALRGKLNMSATELAKRVGISQAQISRLENGKQGFRSNTLNRIAKALGVKPIYFFLEEESAEGSTAERAPIYGIAAGGELVEALRSAEFVRVAEMIAAAYFDQKDAFKAIELAVKAIVGEKD
jgi:transcriptional regulator with XRE-family HTH domain